MARPVEKTCGTRAAYARHLYHGETPCDPCREANNEYTREWTHDRGAQPEATYRAQQRAKAKRENPCGTLAAARRHYRAGESLCDACRKAYNEYHRELMRRLRR